MEVVRFDSESGDDAGQPFQRQPHSAPRAAAGNVERGQSRGHRQLPSALSPDLIFAVKCSFFHPETMRRIRKSTGAPFVNHYPDHPYLGVRWMPKEASALRRDLIEVLRQYSIVFMWERSLVSALQRDGVDSRFLALRRRS